MVAYVGYDSALEFWRWTGCSDRFPKVGQLPRCANGEKWEKPDGALLQSVGIRSEPITYVVDAAAGRRRVLSAAFRVQKRLPNGSFVEVTSQLYVATPEACFVQMASLLPAEEIVRLGFELCGFYSLDVEAGRGFRVRDPLVSVESLREYLALASGCCGVKKAAGALKHVHNGSASPMETILFMLLCLPGSMGGYGLPAPLLNQRIDVDESARKVADRSYYSCDLYWPNVKLAIEYDSDMFHTGSERIASDARKRNALESMGIRVVTVTRPQVYNKGEMDKVARIVSRGLGIYRDSMVKDLERRRLELRRRLLGR